MDADAYTNTDGYGKRRGETDTGNGYSKWIRETGTAPVSAAVAVEVSVSGRWITQFTLVSGIVK